MRPRKIGLPSQGERQVGTTGKPEQLDLERLEQQVDELLGKIDNLSTENSALRRQHEDLVTERARLLDKTQTARSRVEAMIARLKAMERD